MVLAKSTCYAVPPGCSAQRVVPCWCSAPTARSARHRLFARWSFVAQDQTLPRDLSCGSLSGLLREVYPHWDHQRCRDLCERFEIPWRGKNVGDLSGGQQRLAACALALATGAELLLLDEPAAGLDPLARQGLVQALLETVEQGNTAICYSTHLLADPERTATHLAWLTNGQLKHVQLLEDLQQNCCRLQIIFPTDQAAETSTVPGLTQRTVQGPVLSGILQHADPNAALETFETDPAIRVLRHPMNLEDAFCAMAGGADMADLLG